MWLNLSAREKCFLGFAGASWSAKQINSDLARFWLRCSGATPEDVVYVSMHYSYPGISSLVSSLSYCLIIGQLPQLPS
jgi:hypothetical protein